MRKPRIKIHGRTAVYHCISRIVGGEPLLLDFCKEHFRQLMWQQARFCGIQIITNSLMSNHVHLVLRVPESIELSDQQLLERAEAFYGGKGVLVEQLRQAMASKGKLDEGLRGRLLRRMGDVSVFMKELKQRFSCWYNRLHNRFGTLWAERFKSVLVEDHSAALKTVAAYVDLNPVRAGKVEDPKDYRFCGYAEAVAGGREAQEGILSVVGEESWAKGASVYRKRLFVSGGRAGRSDKRALDPEAIRQVLAEGGEIGVAQALRLRIRYLSDGVVLGSQGYVNEVFAEFRDRFGPRRKTGARRMRGLPFKELRTMRDLRVSAFG